jgi:hypothetical protein
MQIKCTPNDHNDNKFNLYFSLLYTLNLSNHSLNISSSGFLRSYQSKCYVVSSVHLHPHSFLLQAVPLLYFVSKCNVGYSLMFIYIHIISYYKLFLYFTLCLSVMLDTLSCSYTSTFFLTTSCSLTLLCVYV